MRVLKQERSQRYDGNENIWALMVDEEAPVWVRPVWVIIAVVRRKG